MNDTLIQDKVKIFVEQDKMFTSVDVGNAIKTEDKTFIKNRDVAAWLRENFTKDQLFKNYNRSLIRVTAGKETYVYHPFFADPSVYTQVDQHALSPQEAGISASNKTNFISNAGNGPFPQSMLTGFPISVNSTTTTVPPGSIDNSVIITDTRMVRISSKIVAKLGWKPGDDVDLSKIDGATIPSITELKVHKDGRVYVARSWLPFGTDAVKIDFDQTSGKITIVKA